MLALEPELVKLDRLSDDPDADHEGIYGRNPRFTASSAFGERQIAAGAELLAERCRTLLAGSRLDPLADLRAFVKYGWPERLLLRGRAGSEPQLIVANPGLSSRYLSAMRLAIDGSSLAAQSVTLVNESPGESGTPMWASELSPENGFYVRRGQEATITLGSRALMPGPHHVRAELGLGGVSSLVLDERVDFVS